MGNTNQLVLVTTVLAVLLQPNQAQLPIYNLQLGLDVFKNYTQVIPICNDSTPVTVTVNLFLYQIVDISLQDQVTTLNIWLDMIWEDCTIAWDNQLYNVNVTQFPNSLAFWVPDIAWEEKNSNVRYTSEYYATQPKQVDYQGAIFTTTQLVPTISCDTTAYFYPFDQQTCEVTFFSVNHDISEMNITSLSNAAVMDYFQQDGRWVVESFDASWSILQVGSREFATVTYSLVVTRRFLYYIVFVASPLVIFAIVAFFVFLIPVPTEEKISYSTNVLLSVCMYFLSLIDYLPVQSDFVPLLGQYIGSLIAMAAACVLFTVITVKMYWRKELKRMSLPPKVHWFFNTLLATGLRMPWTLKENAQAQKKLFEMQLEHFHTHVVSALINLYSGHKDTANLVQNQTFSTELKLEDVSEVASTSDTNELTSISSRSVELNDHTRPLAIRVIKRWRRFAKQRAARRNGNLRNDSIVTVTESESGFSGGKSSDDWKKRDLEKKKKRLFSRSKHKPNMTRHQYFAPCRPHWKRTAGNPWSRLAYVIDRFDFLLFLIVSVLCSVLLFFMYVY